MHVRSTSEEAGNNKPHVAWITNVLAHYRVPCFQKLVELFQGRLTYFFLAEKMASREYIKPRNVVDLPAVYLRGWRCPRPKSLFLHYYDDLHLNDVRPVIRGRYDVLVLGGWDEPTYLLLWAWGVVSRKKILFWCESTTYDTVRRSVREAPKRLLLKMSTGCIVAGRRAYDYCCQLGMPNARIFIAPNAADQDYYQGMAKKLLPLRESLRKEAGIKEFMVIFVGRLEEAHKNVSILIGACSTLEREGKPFSLAFAGDGPDREYYREMAHKMRLRDVRFLGMLDRNALCQYYAMANVLVLPSRSEPWGFVLNEAMEFGLPLVVSEAVGAGPDLVVPGENGFVVPVGDVPTLASALRKLAEDTNLCKRMGETSRRMIQEFSPDRWAQGVLRALETIQRLDS